MPHPLVEAGILPLAEIPYGEQLALRRDRVVRALSRLPIDVEVAPIVPSPRETGARARVNVKLRDGVVGFHAAGTHTFVPVPLDRLARPEVVAAAAGLQGGGDVEIRSDGTQVQVVRGNTVHGPKRLSVGGLVVSAASFYQVNLEVNARIVADVDARLVALAPVHLLDLYAGVGNLSAAASRRGVPATLLESDPSSVADAKRNLPGADVRKGDAARLPTGSVFFDVALLDPPRAGALGVLAELATTRPRAILYLSCEPSTLARDLGTVLSRGYRVTLVQPYDMFPDTEHVETLVVLERA